MHRHVPPPANEVAVRLLQMGAPEGTLRRRSLRLARKTVRSLRTRGLRATAGAARARLSTSLESRLRPPGASPAPTTPPVAALPGAAPQNGVKETLTHLARIALDAFLAGNATLEFKQHAAPRVSVLLVLFNRAELTFSCLNSLLACQNTPYEVVIVDNASTDRTGELLSRIRGARIVRNPDNRGFGAAVNQASREAAGECLLLLNNDAQVLGDSLKVAEQLLAAHPDIGAVGGKILLLDGTLQEAGSIVWQDGNAAGYGRGDHPYAPPYMHLRDVDFCSGAFLMIPRELFLSLGGFDPDYNPAYYEDVDLCTRLIKKGLRVVYHPDVVLLHYESASTTGHTARDLMLAKRDLYLQKHGDWLATRPTATPDHTLAARQQPPRGHRVLYIDDRPPHRWLGTGYPRANQMLLELVRQGHFVTFYPMMFPHEAWPSVYTDTPREVEVMVGHGIGEIGEFLRQRKGYYDLAIISRPHNMRFFRQAVEGQPDCIAGMKILYDAEAIFCLREARQAEVLGKPLSSTEIQQKLQQELKLAEHCDGILSVNEAECEHFRRHGLSDVYPLGHALEIRPTPATFEQRQGLLFVGAIVYDPESPNADAVRWLCREVMPHLNAAGQSPLNLSMAGPWVPGVITDTLDPAHMHVLGRVEDLTPLYDRARMFVAPNRFAGGIPLKIYEAAAHGVPVVASTLMAKQLGWRPDVELLVADDPKEFAAHCRRLHEDEGLWQRLRSAALDAVRRDCSIASFANALSHILSEATATLR